MTDRRQPGSRSLALLRIMAALTMLGLISAIAFLIWYSPITLLLFMIAGQLFMAAAIILYIYVVIRDLKEHGVL